MDGDNQTASGTPEETGDETFIQHKNVKWVLFGIIVILLVMNLVQYRQMSVAQETIQMLGKHIAEMKK